MGAGVLDFFLAMLDALQPEHQPQTHLQTEVMCCHSPWALAVPVTPSQPSSSACRGDLEGDPPDVSFYS